ncbi:MAG: peptidase M3, partial [Bacteroidaceae bacterium]|nr:peptidase M3 [Bacteroidaceae bacterium]
MNKQLPILAALALAACNPKASTEMTQPAANNPLLEEPTNKYELPQFSTIKYSDYVPAVEQGIAAQRSEIKAIVDNPAVPDFDNTILALDNAGLLLERATAVWGLLQGTDDTPELQKVTDELLPMIEKASDEIMLNDKLFARIKTVYDKRETLGLNTAQKRLLEKKYKSFVRSGALLSDEDKE